jgi:hypothetical protein
MQDRYTGDVGDFGKYGLLRHVCGVEARSAIRLGIHWYLTEPEDNKDGRILGYLSDRTAFRQCDPELYMFLQRVRDGKLPREVRSIEDGGVFPSNTLYFSETLSFAGFSKGYRQAIEDRTAYRAEWHCRAVERLNHADVVFLDPDNGLERKTPRHREKGPKYTFIDELDAYVHRGQSLVIYQHSVRDKGGFKSHLRHRMSELTQRFGRRIGNPYCCCFRGSRAFVFLPVGEIGALIVARAKELSEAGSWAKHFQEV